MNYLNLLIKKLMKYWEKMPEMDLLKNVLKNYAKIK